MNLLNFAKKFSILRTIILFFESRIIYFKNFNTLKKNEKYVNKYSGKRCFIIANGPSLNSQDLTLLKNEITFGVNNLMATKAYNQILPKFYTIVDSNFFNDDYEVLSDNLKSLKTLKHKPVCIFPVSKKQYIEKYELDKELEIIYVAYDIEKSTKIKSEFYLSSLLPYSLNVANVSLYAAISMGFSEIYLLGVDMTGVLHTYDEKGEFKDSGHFFESDERLAEYESKKFNVRKNEEMLKIYGKVFQQFRLAYEYAKKRGIKIVNLTASGALDIFPIGKYKKIISE